MVYNDGLNTPSPFGWKDWGTSTDRDLTVDISLVFDGPDNAAGDGVAGDKGNCAAGAVSSGFGGILAGMALLVSFLRRRR